MGRVARTWFVSVVMAAVIGVMVTTANAQTGTISGTVTTDGGVQEWRTVVLSRADIGVVSTAQVFAGPSYVGTYTFSGLAAGTYYVRTTGSHDVSDEAYDDIPCDLSCNALNVGTPIVLEAGQSRTDIDFALTDRRPRIRGTVTGAGGVPLDHVMVLAIDAATNAVAWSYYTDATGAYRSIPLAPGSYRVQFSTGNFAAYLNEAYGGIKCQYQCPYTAGTAVPVSGPTTIDMVLTEGGRIEGTVRDENAVGLAGVSLRVFSAANPTSTLTTAATSANGTYQIRGLLTGSYFVRTSNSAGYLDEIHSQVRCGSSACNGTTPGATAVPVTAGQPAIQVDFSLALGARITGVIRDEATQAQVAGVLVRAINVATNAAYQAYTGLDVANPGAYAMSTLPAGTYTVRATPDVSMGYVVELWQGRTCLPCPTTDATPIPLALGQTASGIDFDLVKGGKISGIVSDATTGSGVPYMEVEVFNAAGTSVAVAASQSVSGSTAIGAYATSVLLPPGRYFARTRATNIGTTGKGYLNEVWDDVACVMCSPTLGTPIDVAAGSHVADVNFALSAGGRISGRVTAADTSLPLAGVAVRVFTASGQLTTSQGTNSVVLTNAQGNWVTNDGLPPGSYYVRAIPQPTSGVSSPAVPSPYLVQQYDGVLCFPSCGPTTGQAVTLPAGTSTLSGIDFALTAGGQISGTVNDALSGIPIRANVRVLNATGAQVNLAAGSVTGGYTTPALVPGQYHLVTSNTLGYVDRVFADVAGVDCVGCDPLAIGTPVAVTAGATAGGRNFTLSPGGRIAGTVFGPQGPLFPATVEFFAQGSALAAGSATTNLAGQYLSGAGFPGGTYTARTVNSLGYVNEVYEDIACLESCSPVGGTPIVVSGTQTTSGVDFVLAMDQDVDGDGIGTTIDKDRTTDADQSTAWSDDFTDVPLGGTTSGTVDGRNGWSLTVTDVSPGVQAQVTGPGSAPLVISACHANDAEEVVLDASGDTATIECVGAEGGTRVRAVGGQIELRKTVNGLATTIEIPPGQAATTGSPAVADPSNTLPLTIRLLDAAGIELGGFVLDPGEVAEATRSSGGAVSVTVFTGVVPVTIGGESAQVPQGQTQSFLVCSPIAVDRLAANPSELWPVHHKMVDVTVTPALKDGCGAASCQILSIVSDEGPLVSGSGASSVDIELTGDLAARLRAERSGTNAAGRTYTITVRCTDSVGNVAESSTTVVVPHNRE